MTLERVSGVKFNSWTRSSAFMMPGRCAAIGLTLSTRADHRVSDNLWREHTVHAVKISHLWGLLLNGIMSPRAPWPAGPRYTDTPWPPSPSAAMVAANGDAVKANGDGMRTGKFFSVDGVEMGLMSTIVSLFNLFQPNPTEAVDWLDQWPMLCLEKITLRRRNVRMTMLRRH